jgi:hypothetical protein
MSKIEVNTVDVQCGSTLTLGSCGKTVALASGASQTGFGRTGTVDWVTTVQTSTPFTAVSGKGYFINTTSGAITMNLPSSPSVGDIVAIKDYAGTFNSNNLTIGRGGSNLDGNAGDKTLDTDSLSLTLVYVDATQGWIPIEEGTGFIGENFVTATGGTITTVGDYKIHTFTGPGCFEVTKTACCSTANKLDYLVVAGGGGGGGTNCTSAGGGGAGGLRFYANTPTNPQAANPSNPINNFPSGTTITASVATYPITVGAGGAGGPDKCAGPTLGTNGSVSTFSTVTSAGGGGGHGYKSGQPLIGNPGGSGGAGSYGGAGGNGNQPPVSPSQGNNGGDGDNSPQLGGGGGGAIAVGTTASGSTTGNGGAGAGFTGFGASNGQCSSCKQYFAGGGGGGSDSAFPAGGTGGLGGGGAGGRNSVGTAGTANTGGGGGGSQSSPTSARTGGAGGSGVVIIRYKFQ